jgi:hypothetical protein
MRMVNAFGCGWPGGNVQLIVGFTRLAELVIVTLEGKGTGVVGIGAADGNGMWQ